MARSRCETYPRLGTPISPVIMNIFRLEQLSGLAYSTLNNIIPSYYVPIRFQR